MYWEDFYFTIILLKDASDEKPEQMNQWQGEFPLVPCQTVDHGTDILPNTPQMKPHSHQSIWHVPSVRHTISLMALDDPEKVEVFWDKKAQICKHDQTAKGSIPHSESYE